MTDARNISRDNHYVPLAMLRRWSTDGVHLFGYRLLVPHLQYPVWRRHYLKGIANLRDLYTVYLHHGSER